MYVVLFYEPFGALGTESQKWMDGMDQIKLGVK